MALAVIQIKRTRLAEFDEFAINYFPSPRRATTDNRLSVHHPITHLATRPKNGCLAIIGDEEVECAVAVQIRSSDRSAPKRFGNQACGCSGIRKMPVAFVD